MHTPESIQRTVRTVVPWADGIELSEVTVDSSRSAPSSGRALCTQGRFFTVGH